MMSLAHVNAAAAAGGYYERDDYYSEDGQSPSTWYGRGADALHLEGHVDRQTFHDMLDGRLPDGTTMSAGRNGDRRPAFDATFSAPKSVSIQALIGGDRRLIDAHESAVRAALNYIEIRIAGYRETKGGETVRVKSQNLIAATFRHDVSRALDPQLHTHAVLINATQRADGQWRSLDASALFRDQMTVGAVYRAHLAREIRALGFQIRVEHHDGRFELAHISGEQIKAFSTRSTDIEADLAARGLDRDSASPYAREMAALASRDAKKSVDRETLREEWREAARVAGVNFTPGPVVDLENERHVTVADAVAFAIDHATERKSIVAHSELLAASLGFGAGAVIVDEAEAEIQRRVESGELLKEGEHYTTAAAQRIEREILEIEKRGRGVLQMVVRQSWLSGSEDGRLTSEQWAAARTILATGDRVVGVNGWAGTGKTTLLKEVVTVAEAGGYEVVGLAPSAAAAQQLESTGVRARTIADFLARGAPVSNTTMVIVDEAGMVGARDMHCILGAVEAAGARVVLVGDTQQLKAVAAGMPLRQLQEQGMPNANLQTIQRQNNPELAKAVALAAGRDVRAAVRRLARSTYEVPYATDRWSAIASQYSDLAEKDRRETLIVVGTHRAREQINGMIRQRLGLAGQGIKIKILVPRDLTEAQRRTSDAYSVGDLVRAGRDYEQPPMKRGDIAEVVGKTPGRLTVRLPGNVLAEWQPARTTQVTAYRLDERELACGDVVRITANVFGVRQVDGSGRQLAGGKLVNGQTLVVQSISPSGDLTLRTQQGKLVQLSTKQALPLDHGYATTVYAAQGRSVDRVLVDADTRSATSHESMFYVAVSRARSEAHVYTDDRASLPEVMSRADVKTVALDLTPDQPSRANSMER
jgi:conjugative relaxase-like TrwC/TraI family protein